MERNETNGKWGEAWSVARTQPVRSQDEKKPNQQMMPWIAFSMIMCFADLHTKLMFSVFVPSVT